MEGGQGQEEADRREGNTQGSGGMEGGGGGGGGGGGQGQEVAEPLEGKHTWERG